MKKLLLGMMILSSSLGYAKCNIDVSTSAVDDFKAAGLSEQAVVNVLGVKGYTVNPVSDSIYMSLNIAVDENGATVAINDLNENALVISESNIYEDGLLSSYTYKNHLRSALVKLPACSKLL